MNRWDRMAAGGALLLLLNSGWVWAFPEADLFYIANVLLHLGLGVFLLAAFWAGRGELLRAARGDRPVFVLLSVAGVLGLVLAWIGATTPNMKVVVAHGAAGFVGAAALAVWARRRSPRFAAAIGAALVVSLGFPAYAALRSNYYPAADDRIVNPTTAPVSMDYEGAGVDSPFFPSASTTNTGDLIPSDFFMDSKVCGDCHVDVYEQWAGSMHRWSSFNNQFYRKSIEYMQDVAGVEPSKWCAGCHDHAMFFNGRFDTPVKEQIDTPQAHAGLGCMSCHSITHIPDSMGNGGMRMEYPPLHDLSKSENALIHAVQKYVTETAPAAHRRAFIKPFMREDGAEFCSTCHKVHLDVPVNDYRWIRGFNEYDSWQASGVSGHGARSFYYPAASADCADCHMPLVASDDPGNINGFVHSHRFPAANTAVPYINGDDEQLRITEEFLQSGIVSVDIFAASPAEEIDEEQALRRASQAPQAATAFAVGEEAEGGAAPAVLREVGELSAPIDRTRPALRPGDTVKVDVVVRTLKVGHFFPGGTVDSVDCWIELKAIDAAGRTVFESGGLLEDGPVEPGAHFYRSFMLDEHGNPINKRNAFQTRSVLYARLIPPGAADVAHYRIKIPADAEGPIRLEAKVNYRKFSDYYTKFSFAGQPDPDDPAEHGRGFEDRRFTFNASDIPANVSSEKYKDSIPALPVTVLAEATSDLTLGDVPPEWSVEARAEDHIRWNDYGIGLLLQGDLRGAQFAFERVIEAKPDFADGWLNFARSLIEEGRTEDARPYVEKTLELAPDLARGHYFAALADKAAGDFDSALEHLRQVEAQYPRDRVALNQAARIRLLRREYVQALELLDRVARIDPEDLQMHYTRMLCYRGLGNNELADEEEEIFLRFKADESSQTRTARIRRANPADNNERQPIHEHATTVLAEGFDD